MSVAIAFKVFNQVALLGWACLILAPNWSVTRAVVRTGALSLAFSFAYALLIFSHWHIDAASFSSLDGVSKLFADPAVLLAGWVHYLAFDLFVGSWITEDAMLKGRPRAFLILCLILTFLLGPLGLLLYRASDFFSGGKR